MAKQTVNLSTKIVLRNDTTLNWTTTNPVLLKGEIGIDVGKNMYKIGNGLLAWKQLKYHGPVVEIENTDYGEAPSLTANDYPAGSMVMNTAGNVFIANLDTNGGNVWTRLMTTDDISKLSLMSAGYFAKSPGAGSATGYVDKALRADTATTAISAEELASTRFFSITGDVTSSREGFCGDRDIQLAATLKSSGVTAGTHTKVTVDPKGIVTKGEALAVSDIPTLPTSKIAGLGTAATLNTGAAAGNIPVLIAGGKLPDSVIPNLAIGEIFETASEAAMLALSSAQRGDICIRSDVNKSFVLSLDTPAVVAAWKELKTPTDTVLSVNGLKGAVTITTANISESGNLYYTQARFDAALAAKSTTNIAEGTNLYYTDARVQAFVENSNNIFILNGGNATGN